MSTSAPPAPAFGQALPGPALSANRLAFLALRRSLPVAELVEPGPSPEVIADMLRLAARAPDHGKREPWRFLVFAGEARHAAGGLFAKRLAEQEPGVDVERLALERGRFTRAPLVVAVISAAQDDPKIPVWEQQMSAGAVTFGLVLAAHAHGFAATWLTEWVAYDSEILSAFGLTERERIAGYVHIGAPGAEPRERVRPDTVAKTSWWASPQPA